MTPLYDIMTTAGWLNNNIIINFFNQCRLFWMACTESWYEYQDEKENSKWWSDAGPRTLLWCLHCTPLHHPSSLLLDLQFPRLPVSGLDSTWASDLAKTLPIHLELLVCIMQVTIVVGDLLRATFWIISNILKAKIDKTKFCNKFITNRSNSKPLLRLVFQECLFIKCIIWLPDGTIGFLWFSNWLHQTDPFSWGLLLAVRNMQNKNWIYSILIHI